MKDKNKMDVSNSGWNWTALWIGGFVMVFTIAAIAIGLVYSAQRSWVGGWQYASDEQSISNRLNVTDDYQKEILANQWAMLDGSNELSLRIQDCETNSILLNDYIAEVNAKLDAYGVTIGLLFNIAKVEDKLQQRTEDRLKVLEQDNRLGMLLSNLFIPVQPCIINGSNSILIHPLNGL